MKILLKLCWRALLHRKFRLGSTILAIAAVSCLMIWFVGSLDLTSMLQRDTVRHTFGEYSLAMFRDDGFSSEDLAKLAASDLIEYLDSARQTDPEVTLNGVEFTSAAFRQSPKLTGIDRMNAAPFSMDEGRWFTEPGECVVSSTAEAVLFRGAEGDRKFIEPGDTLTVKTAAGETVLTVVGTFKQSAMAPQTAARRGPTGTFSFGFGSGLGVSQKKPAAPQASSVPQASQSTASAGNASVSAEKAAQAERGPRGKGGRGQAALSGGNGGERRKAIRGPWSAAEVGLSAPAVYVSMEDQHKISGAQGAVNLIFVKLKPEKTPEEFYAQAETILGKPLEELEIEKADAVTLQAQTAQKQSVDTIFAQAWAAMGIVIVTAILIIFTTLNMDVSERTRYLAMLRTLGLTRFQVACSVILEGLFLGILGWLLGMLAGWGLLEWLAYSSSGEWIFLPLSGANILLAFICTLAGAFIASIVPAIRATFVSPVESMVRRNRNLGAKDLFIAALLGVILLGIIPYIVFLPMENETRQFLFGTLGTFCFGMGFFLFFPWTILATERIGAPILAFLFRFDPRFLRDQLAGNQLRSLMTALIMSLGLGLYTAILIWSSSMLYRFVTQEGTIPFALVRIDDAITSDEAASALRQMPGVDPEKFMETAVAQPQLEKSLGEKMQDAGAMNPSVVLMGVDPNLAYAEKDPMIDLRFLEGDRESARLAMTAEPQERVCVVTSELSENGGLRVGDTLRLQLPGKSEPPRYASYRIIGVADFPGMLWFTKFGNVRVNAGRCCAMAFAPREIVKKDFRTPENEFFWFNTQGKVPHKELQESLTKIVYAQTRRNFLPETDAEFNEARFAEISDAKESGISGMPDFLVSLHPGAARKEAAFAIRALDGMPTEDLLYVNAARASLTDGGTAILYGVDPQIAFRLTAPMLSFPFTEGSAADALKALCDSENACVVTAEFAKRRGLKLGDTVTLNLPKDPNAAASRGPGKGGPGMGGRGGNAEGPGSAGPGMGGRGRNAAGPGSDAPGMGGRGGNAVQTAEFTIAGIVEFPEWQKLAERTGTLMRRDVETVIFTTQAPVKNEFRAKEFQHYWFPLRNGTDRNALSAGIQDAARKAAVLNRGSDLLARRDMIRQMQGAQLATIESVNGSLQSRAGNVIGMMTKMPLIMLAISTIAILNTMIVSVFTRRWEMGVLRACGITRSGLVRLILAEAILIGSCAIAMSFLFGIFYSWLLIHITSMFGIVTPPLIIPWSKVGFGFTLTLCFCLAASIYPALVAGRKEPVELLRRKE